MYSGIAAGIYCGRQVGSDGKRYRSAVAERTQSECVRERVRDYIHPELSCISAVSRRCITCG